MVSDPGFMIEKQAVLNFYLCIIANPYFTLCVAFLRKIKMLKTNIIRICEFCMGKNNMHN